MSTRRYSTGSLLILLLTYVGCNSGEKFTKGTCFRTFGSTKIQKIVQYNANSKKYKVIRLDASSDEGWIITNEGYEVNSKDFDSDNSKDDVYKGDFLCPIMASPSDEKKSFEDVSKLIKDMIKHEYLLKDNDFKTNSHPNYINELGYSLINLQSIFPFSEGYKTLVDEAKNVSDYLKKQVGEDEDLLQRWGYFQTEIVAPLDARLNLNQAKRSNDTRQIECEFQNLVQTLCLLKCECELGMSGSMNKALGSLTISKLTSAILLKEERTNASKKDIMEKFRLVCEDKKSGGPLWDKYREKVSNLMNCKN